MPTNVTNINDSWGTIKSKGVLEMPLEYHNTDLFKQKAEEAQKDTPKGWKMSFKTVVLSTATTI